MNNGDIIEINGVEINSTKAKLMLHKLIMKERTNLQTKELNDVEMVKYIKNMIEEEVKCY